MKKYLPTPDLNLTVIHRVNHGRKTTSKLGDRAIALINDTHTQWNILVSECAKVDRDESRTEGERKIIIRDLANKWMKHYAPRHDAMAAEIADYRDRCDIALNGCLEERDAGAMTSGAEVRTFLRVLNNDKRDVVALANAKFMAAVASQPAELSGVTPETHAQCVRATQATRSPDRYADAQDYAFMAPALRDQGQAMIAAVRDVLAATVVEKRYEPAGPTGQAPMQF